MKKILLMMLLLASMASNAQERKYSTFYYQRATLFEELPVTSKDIIFLGNSITNGGEWSELLNNKHSPLQIQSAGYLPTRQKPSP